MLCGGLSQLKIQQIIIFAKFFQPDPIYLNATCVSVQSGINSKSTIHEFESFPCVFSIKIVALIY